MNNNNNWNFGNPEPLAWLKKIEALKPGDA
jgi:hypothetical protein